MRRTFKRGASLLVVVAVAAIALLFGSISSSAQPTPPGGGFVPPGKLGRGSIIGGTCGSGSAVVAINGSGAITCGSAGATLAGSANNLLKFTGSNTAGGALPTDNGTLLTTNETLLVNQALALGSAVSATFGGTQQDNFTTAGLASATVLDLTVTSDTTLTGIVAPATDGTLLNVRNLSASTNKLTIAISGSTAGNLIVLPGGGAWTLPPGTSVLLRYSTTHWRAIGLSTYEYPLLTVDGLATLSGGFTSATGTATVGDFRSTVITPSAVVGVANVNDYNPTGLSTAGIILQDTSTGVVTFTGLAGGASGRSIAIVNISATFNQIFANENSGSTAANRFTIGGGTIQVTPGGMTVWTYDGTSSRWRLRSITSANSNLATLFNNVNLTGTLTVTNAVNIGSTLGLTTNISPTALSGSTNDYAPTNLSTASILFQDVSSAATLTGLTASYGGRILTITNIATNPTNTLTLTNEDPASLGSSRFTLPVNASPWVIPAGGSVMLRYSATATRWRPINSMPVVSGTGTVTSVVCGGGLGGGTITSTGTCSVDNTVEQARIATGCGSGSAIQSVDGSGNPTCIAVGSGGGGTGLSGLTPNTVMRALSSSTIGSGTATDNGTTFQVTQFAFTTSDDTSTTGTCNDYALAATATTLQTNCSVLSGLSGGVDGRLLVVENENATTNTTITNEASGSTAANRVQTLGAVTWTLKNAGHEFLVLKYNAGVSRWQQIAFSTATIPVSLTLAGLSSSANVTINGAALVTGTTNARLRATGSSPTLSSCGTSPTITSSQGTWAFALTTGTGATACTITLGTFGGTPSCNVTDRAGAVPPYSIASNVVTLTTATAGHTYDVTCVDH